MPNEKRNTTVAIKNPNMIDIHNLASVGWTKAHNAELTRNNELQRDRKRWASLRSANPTLAIN